MANWLKDAEVTAWRGFVKLYTAVNADLELDLQEQQNMSIGEYAVLVMLSEAPDLQLRMCDLASELALSPSGLTRRIDGLVKQGFVTRVSDTGDRRVTFCRLTDLGFDKIRAAAPRHVEMVRHTLLRHLTDNEKHEFSALLEIVLEGRASSQKRLDMPRSA
jgi:DNA-binding MarR family transcriptional regulator